MLRLLAAILSAATVHVASALNSAGILSLTFRCDTGAACTGTYELPQLDPGNPVAFSVAAGATKTIRIMLCGPCKTTAASLKTLTVKTVVDGVATTSSVRLVQGAPLPKAGGRSGNSGPPISRGPATHYQSVRDKRGDNHSAFNYPVNFDLVSASAKRVGNSVVFTVTSLQPLTMHDGYGIPVAPCVEIPYTRTPGPITPKQLLPSGNIAGASNKPNTPWPKIRETIHGSTISWTVPRKYLFTLGFLWRATAGCNPKYPADVAPDAGYETFRWATVK